MPQINDRLGGDEALLDLLYDFLGREPPLNPLLASFFSKTIGNLIARKTEQVRSLRAGLAAPAQPAVAASVRRGRGWGGVVPAVAWGPAGQCGLPSPELEFE